MSPTLWTYSLIAFGGALGSVARFWFSGFIAHQSAKHFLWGETFPWGTLLVNITGSFVIGFFATLTGPDGRWLISSPGRQFFMIGICGGYTTFSSFSLQTLELMREGDWLKAGVNSVASLVLCLIAVWLGHILAMGINSTKGS
ncbi:MAG: CrcB protein [Pedosphaera sp.]|nr:CrcB protein [Pedosphaera sp.]